MSPEPREEPFFVGYLPMPPSLRWFALGVAGLLLVAIVGAGAALAGLQRRPGPGIEPYARGQVVRGVLHAAPYPHVTTVDEQDRVRHVFLVTTSKFGYDRANELDGQGVELPGNMLERDGSRLLEVTGSANEVALPPDALGRLAAVESQDLGEHTLRGEIVDSKCYYGRMRPGGGRGHRACAQLCIRGGIPPVLVTRGPDGASTHYVLSTADGRGPVTQRVLPFVAEPVAVHGRVVEREGSRMLQLSDTPIERL